MGELHPPPPTLLAMAGPLIIRFYSCIECLPNGLMSQYTKIKHNFSEPLRLKVTDTFFPFFVSPNKCIISKDRHFCTA